MKTKLSIHELPRALNELLKTYDRKFLANDPVYFVHQYADPRDQELVAFVSALLAFGNVKAIHASVQKVLDVMGPSPVAYVQDAVFCSSNLGHRWVRAADLKLLFSVLGEVYRRYNSLQSCFLAGYDEGDPDIGPALGKFSKLLLSFAGPQPLSRSFRYFFPSPEDGSPCKRLSLFLRWMIRPADGIDLGLWKISPSKLIIPLDTHIFGFARRFRLSRHKNPNWKAACDVTNFLKTIDSEDPVKYDFPICHYGMEKGW